LGGNGKWGFFGESFVGQFEGAIGELIVFVWGAIVDESDGLIEYWRKTKIFGFCVFPYSECE